MEQVNACALELAEAMVHYYEMKAHCDAAGSNVLRQDAAALREAYSVMMSAQSELARASEEEALKNA